MTFLADFHFMRPVWLLLAPLVVALWQIERRERDPLRGWRELIDPELLGPLTVGQQSVQGKVNASPFLDRVAHWKNVTSCFGSDPSRLAFWLLAVVAVAGPTWRPEPSPFADDPAPVMMVLRAGESMNAADLTPNRMERARLKVADFAAARIGLPLGLVAYSGSSHLVLPPTRDTSVVATMAAEISPEIMPRPGDNLAAALTLAAETLGADGGSLVVVADAVSSDNQSALTRFRQQHRLPVEILAIARSNTPELDALHLAADSLDAQVTTMTPDSSDVETLVRRTAKAPIGIASGEGSVRWAEAGWWLTPVLVLLVLATFRREQADATGNPGTFAAHETPA